jgi:hypothetical protein
MRLLFAATALATGTLIACGGPAHGPVPITGTPADIAALEGEWSGAYHSYVESGRSGTIHFRLAAGQDTARGDVLMHIAGREAADALPRYDPWVDVAPSRILHVTFVRAAGSTIFGRLDPYHDPVCGCDVETTFTGRIRGNLLEGNFVSQHLNGADRIEGRWRVVRSSP